MNEDVESTHPFGDWEAAWGTAIVAKDWPRVQQLLMEACFIDGGDTIRLNERYARLVLPALGRMDVIASESLSSLLVAISGDASELDEVNRRRLLEFCQAGYPAIRDPAARAWAESFIRDWLPAREALEVLIGVLKSTPEEARDEVLFGVALAASAVSVSLGERVAEAIRGAGGKAVTAIADEIAAACQSPRGPAA